MSPQADPRPSGEPFAWPSPREGHYPAPARQSAPEPCELESPQGRVTTGTLMVFNPEAGVALVRLANGPRTLTLRFAQFRRLTLLRALPALPPPRGFAPDATTPLPQLPRVVYCRLLLRDGPEVVVPSVGHLESPAGYFTFRLLDEDGAVERSFYPKARVSAFAVSEYAPDSADLVEDTVPMPLVDLSELVVDPASATHDPAPPGQAPADGAGKLRTPAAAAAADMLSGQIILTSEQLLVAIEQQARMPMVRIGEALMALGYVTEARLGDALQAQSRDRSLPLGELLVRRGDISREDLQTALARKMGYPIVDAAHFPVEPEAALRLPVSLARRLTALPLIVHQGALIVALEDPSARAAVDEIEFSAQCKAITVLARAGTLGQAIERVYQRLGKEAIEPTDDLVQALAFDGDGDTTRLLASLEQQSVDSRDDEPQIEQSDNSLVRLINTMILEARAQGVSDIHIETQPGREKVRVRFRRDGSLKPYIELPHTYRSALIARIKIMCDLDISERRKPQDGKISFGRFVQGQRLELRVATIPTANGVEDVVMRLLASARALPLEGMGLHPQTLAQLKAVIARPYGMVLCVGPTGSGKTTTLHAALAQLNTADRKIWTAEDPVEITQAGLRQVQVNPKIDWTFAKALRAFLRADPDIIMVGESRDKETVSMGIEASLTGHLVFSTLHTNDAASAVTRLVAVSTFSVYDYSNLKAGSVIDETTPIDLHPTKRDEYAQTKLLQEQLYRAEMARREVVILRPGMIYGRDNLWHALLGAELGPLFLRIGSRATLPMTYVENCVAAMVAAIDATGVAGETINIVDDDLPTQAEYVAALERQTEIPSSIPVPWPLMKLAATTISAVNDRFLDGRAKFPGIVVPEKLDGRFKPFRYNNDRARRLLGWAPQYTLAQAFTRSLSDTDLVVERAGST